MKKFKLYGVLAGVLLSLGLCREDDHEGLLTTGTVTDIDGNVYPTIQIGTQTWMGANLRTTKYNDGTAIPNATSDQVWSNYSTGAFCWYNNDVNNKLTYGALYNWFAVSDSRKLAPVGWHVPSHTEWNTLITFLGGEVVAGGKMKETGTAHWNSPNTGADNSSGFVALPGGGRNMGGTFAFLGQSGFWWSSTSKDEYEAWSQVIENNYTRINRYADFQSSGFSVRCVKN